MLHASVHRRLGRAAVCLSDRSRVRDHSRLSNRSKVRDHDRAHWVSRRPHRYRLFLVLALLTPLASAQNSARDAARLDSIAVTATRQAQPIADVLADITVIGADEIARAGAQSLSQLLSRQPGVEIVQNGGPGAVSGVF